MGYPPPQPTSYRQLTVCQLQQAADCCDVTPACVRPVILEGHVQVLYLLEVFILAHYGPLSTETPTTETTIVRCHKNS